MKLNIHTFLLKSIPYLMSIAGGIILYTGAIDNAPNDNIRDLVINVSASLLSIPLVFLLYDYTNSRVANQMKKALENTISDKLNNIISNLILLLRESMNVKTKLTLENLNRMLIWRAPEISKRLNITNKTITKLHECHNDLDNLLYRNGQINILETEHIQILAAIARDITHIINENKFRRNKHMSAKYIENMMSRMLDWLDMDAITAMHLSQHIEDAHKSGT